MKNEMNILFKKNTENIIPLQVTIVGSVFLLLLFIFFIYRDSQKKYNLIDVSFKMKIDTTKVIWGNDRGGIEFNDSLVIASYCPVIQQPEGFDEWSSGPPLIDGDDNPYIYRLGDLRVPYYLYKEANSDTIFVFSKGYTLKFLLMETPEEHTRYLDSLYKTMD